MEEVLGVSIERFAETEARMQGGFPRAQTLAQSGLSEDDWDYVQEAWLAWLADEASRGRHESLAEYHRLLAKWRDELALQLRTESKGTRGQAPRAPEAILPALASEHRTPRARKRAARGASGGNVAPALVNQEATAGVSAAPPRDAPAVIPFSPQAAPRANLGQTMMGSSAGADLPFSPAAAHPSSPAAAQRGGLPFAPPSPQPARPAPSGALPFVTGGASPPSPPVTARAEPEKDPLAQTTSESVSPFARGASALPFAAQKAQPEKDPLAQTTTGAVASPFSPRGGGLPFAPGAAAPRRSPAPAPAQQGGLPFRPAQHAAPLAPEAPAPPPSRPPTITIQQYAWLEASIERAGPQELPRLLNWCKLNPNSLAAVRAQFAQRFAADAAARGEFERALAEQRQSRRA